jgi:glutamate-1-semialdehyde 2,1-aminomutase
MSTRINRSRLADLLTSEREMFAVRHPRSYEHSLQAGQHLVTGVPMPWMTRWPGGFPIFFEEAHGAHFVDIDGHEYIDFCLGDTGAMTGHGLAQVTEAMTARARRGITTMLPSTDAAVIGDELTERFGLTKWQFAMTATDANRFVLRYARQLTGRPKIVVMDWCYHGTVDETLVIMDKDGKTVSRPGAIGPQVDPALTTRVVPFNDADALDRALANGDVACVLMEPALTNIGIVLPEPGYLEQVREISRRHGVYLIIDETHTICAGPGVAPEHGILTPISL